ncbi:hypothetical protein STEG23_000596, partial [Scotinomys teguina]
VLRRELKEKEYSVLNAVDQARVFLADQPIEAPEEPRKNLQSKTDTSFPAAVIGSLVTSLFGLTP